MKTKTIATALCISMFLSNTVWSMETSEQDESEPSCNILDLLQYFQPRHHLDYRPTKKTDCNDSRKSPILKQSVSATPKKNKIKVD